MFVDKAREIYSALPVEHNARYQTVKDAVLKAYEQCLRHIDKNLETAPKMTDRLMWSLPVKRKGFLIGGVRHRR